MHFRTGNISYLNIFIFLLIFLSCNDVKMKSPQQHGILYIDPTSYTDNGLKLSDISDEIIYIPLKSDSPIGQINDLKFMNNSMYINIGDSAIIKFNKEGKQENRIGRLGQGPGEYLFCNSFGIDDKGTISLVST